STSAACMSSLRPSVSKACDERLREENETDERLREENEVG
ncbi:MAG: hypothetical protein QOG47_2749, partial [Mycobacterium sp.]|nr:hypothetical protein [Mycobacterium sp.]